MGRFRACSPAQSASTVVARLAAVAVTLFAGLIGLASRKVIMIRRGKTSRQQMMALCKQHNRYLIYTEGTRRENAPDADEPCALRAGGLKNIFESGDAAHIVITVGKEVRAPRTDVNYDVVAGPGGAIVCARSLHTAVRSLYNVPRPPAGHHQ